jgi:hypothetical protein
MVIQTIVKSDDGQTYQIDTIEHEGGLWLVPMWLATPYPHMRKPVRIILTDKLAHKDLGRVPGTDLHLFSLDDLIPKAVLDGIVQSQSTEPFDVVEGPELMIRR